MAGRHFHLSNGSLFFTWLIAGIVILLMPQRITSKVWDIFRATFNPVLKMGRNVNEAYPSMPLDPGQTVTREQYTELWKDYNNLKVTLRKLHEDYNKLASIRSELPRSYGALVIAQVVGPLSNYRHDVVINKGTNDGVETGQYVLSSKKNCVIGVILESSERYAKVRLLTDTEQGFEVRIINDARNRDIPGLMFGDGKSACKIKMIKRERKVEAGDAVFAAAQPGYLNVPVVIGEVVDVQPDEEHPLLWDITVQPVEDMTKLDDIAVIVTENF